MLEWSRKQSSTGTHVNIQTMMQAEYTVSYGNLIFGTLHLEWLNENGIFAPHQHALGHMLAGTLAEALCTMRGLSTQPEQRSDQHA